MYVSFDTLSDRSRLWVYQAERELNTEEQQSILESGKNFMDQWVTHGVPLSASIQVLMGYFVVIAVDDSQLPSGCSIDTSVGFMRALGSKMDIDFFGRNQIPLYDNERVVLAPLAKLKDQLKLGEVPKETLMINTLIPQKGDLSTWIIPLSQSWLSRYLPQPLDKY